MTQQLEQPSSLAEHFVLSQSFIYDTEKDFEEIVKNLENNFETQQQDNWTKYWKAHGDDIVLQQWNLKYKDYLDSGEEPEIYSEDQIKEINEQEEIITEGVSLTQEAEENTATSEGWNELWQQHNEEVYCEQYILYTTVYNNFSLDLIKSIQHQNNADESLYNTPETETKAEKFCDIEPTRVKNEEEEEEYDIIDELRSLELLGLPTAFGNKTVKKRRNEKQQTTCETNEFLLSEQEDILELLAFLTDEMKTKTVNKSDTLHQLQNQTLKCKLRKNRYLRKIPPEFLEDKRMLKYWYKRYSLFSRFDEGIRLDRESWFSVTPEKVAENMAKRLCCDVLVDGFCGSGGNAIQFAKYCRHVIAIDIDPLKVEMAKHNAGIYGVASKIEFIVGDFLQLCDNGKLKCDAVFLSPPWGGPSYNQKQDYDIEEFLEPIGAIDLMAKARKLSENIGIFLPRNSNMKQIIKLAGIGKRCEVEYNYLDTRLVGITALYGEKYN